MTLVNDVEWKLGKRMRVARISAGLEQLDLAPLVGASRATISAWENDGREPSFSQMVAWANATSQSLDWLAAGVSLPDLDSNQEPIVYRHDFATVGDLLDIWATAGLTV